MEQVKIAVLNNNNEIVAENCGESETALVYKSSYCEGDKILIEVEEKDSFYWLQLDESMGKSIVYIKGNIIYDIPFGDRKLNISPKCFEGERHLLTIKKAKSFEYNHYRNLSFNVNDQHGQINMFPHASANVETRGEAVFAAMNAIDGVVVPQSHGKWPYESWGINMRDDAKWHLDFGRLVAVDRIIIYLRADFPHDNWWERGKITFSDGTEMIVNFEKGGFGQEFLFETKNIEWLEFSDLKKADDPSPFPALTQFEVYGVEKL